jgi:hypothetical protein
MIFRVGSAVRASLVAGLLLGPAAAIVAPAVAYAQAATIRSLTGTVSDKAGNKVANAVVHLKDIRSLAQRSYITSNDGTFRFGQLSGNSDYEVWATLDDKKTGSKSISSFDTKKEIDLALKLPN